jgi:hypothetical protein
MKRMRIKLITVLSIVVSAFCAFSYAQQANEPPPLPFHDVEGCGGVFATHMAYLVNGDPNGGIGLPAAGGIYVNMGHGRQMYSAIATETLWNRLELGYAYISFDMGDLPDAIADATTVRISEQFVEMHNFNARLMLLKEGEFGQSWLPAVTFGAHYKQNTTINGLDRELGGSLTSIGIDDSDGVDYTLYATKMLTMLPKPVIVTAGVRSTEAAHIGLLGFTDERKLLVEGSVCVFVAKNVVVGVEYRQKPSEYTSLPDLIGAEDDWLTFDVGYIVNSHMTVAAGYARFGEVLNHEANGSYGLALKWEL